MIGPADLYRKTLNGMLSLTATVNQPHTGSLFQEWLLRGMGVEVAGPVAFGPRAIIRDGFRLKLGRGVSVGANATFSCYTWVTIGDDFLAADDLTINTGGHEPWNLVPSNRPVTIGARVWCGARVTICAGVTVGDDAIIGAGAVVVRPVEANTVVAGVPARPVRTFERAPADQMWSPFPPRSRYHRYHQRGRVSQLLTRLRQRF